MEIPIRKFCSGKRQVEKKYHPHIYHSAKYIDSGQGEKITKRFHYAQQEEEKKHTYIPIRNIGGGERRDNRLRLQSYYTLGSKTH